MPCFKLNIDRSKAPKKMGTLKDISLFGSFAFPMDGEYASGLVAQSLAGVGKMVKKDQGASKKAGFKRILLGWCDGVFYFIRASRASGKAVSCFHSATRCLHHPVYQSCS